MRLRPETYDQALEIAAELGASLFELELDWNQWTAEKGEEIKSPDGAFIDFRKSRLSSKPEQMVSGAEQLGLHLPEFSDQKN